MLRVPPSVTLVPLILILFDVTAPPVTVKFVLLNDATPLSVVVALLPLIVSV